jgi:predicted TIM-barrel fold metal-dependent hydrolase
MLVDINTYIGHWPFRQRKYNTCEARLERMNRFGVDLAVVSSLNGIFYKNPQSANEELYDEIRSGKNFQDRLIPFAVINPIYEAWKNHFNVSTEQLGMRGIRLYPQYHGYALTDPACIELVKRARDRDLPVALSLRMVDSRPSSWMDLDRKGEWALRDVVPLVKEAPDAKFLILNVANSMQLSPEETALLRSANVLMDTSGRNIIQLGKLIQLYGEEKFAFGSHAPILDDLTGLLRIESLRENEADERVKTRLRSGNAKAMLRI